MRQDWNTYWFDIARMVATRSTCPRAHVGCVLVRDNRIVMTGYNGSLPGEPHCDDVGCDIQVMSTWTDAREHCKRTIHAEANAIFGAARMGVAVAGCFAYVTKEPCLDCYRALGSAGITDIRVGPEWLPSLTWQDIVAAQDQMINAEVEEENAARRDWLEKKYPYGDLDGFLEYRRTRYVAVNGRLLYPTPEDYVAYLYAESPTAGGESVTTTGGKP